ncbi:uncharacterized protein SCHCODRAFT_02619978, partial [Schizophyllum commune H4-8]|uniref:uncharacterized protein n=1 Tax=Schizophyllum commune (strain H4-8 / FGSC 9210) TaxID=578458 RepID=UPI00216092D6
MPSLRSCALNATLERCLLGRSGFYDRGIRPSCRCSRNSSFTFTRPVLRDNFAIYIVIWDEIWQSSSSGFKKSDSSNELGPLSRV